MSTGRATEKFVLATYDKVAAANEKKAEEATTDDSADAATTDASASDSAW